MKRFSKYLAAFLLTALGFSYPAQAAEETVTATSTLTPKYGTFFKKKATSAKLVFRADVSAPPTSARINPMKRVRITFPSGMTFHPNRNRTPACPDSRLSPMSNLADPEAVIRSCAGSVIGTGTAAIYLAKINAPAALISDPILVAFNAGMTAQSQPRLKIYGYSKTTNVGILMSGTLRGRILDIAVPVLSNDSAVKYFELRIPGPHLERPEIGVDTRGLDPNYVRARCANGKLITAAVFELGERTYPGGIPIGPTTQVASSPSVQSCKVK